MSYHNKLIKLILKEPKLLSHILGYRFQILLNMKTFYFIFNDNYEITYGYGHIPNHQFVLCTDVALIEKFSYHILNEPFIRERTNHFLKTSMYKKFLKDEGLEFLENQDMLSDDELNVKDILE